MENQKITVHMNRIFKTLTVVALMAMPMFASAQKSADPQGALAYCLPSTVINLEVEAVQEKFYAGPYAKYHRAHRAHHQAH